MPDLVGITLWCIGILFIIISIYMLNLLKLDYKDRKDSPYIYLAIFFLFIFILARILLRLYSNNLAIIGLPQDILTEKLLFARIFLQIPFIFAATIFLILSYAYFMKLKYKLK